MINIAEVYEAATRELYDHYVNPLGLSIALTEENGEQVVVGIYRKPRAKTSPPLYFKFKRSENDNDPQVNWSVLAGQRLAFHLLEKIFPNRVKWLEEMYHRIIFVEDNGYWRNENIEANTV